MNVKFNFTGIKWMANAMTVQWNVLSALIKIIAHYVWILLTLIWMKEFVKFNVLFNNMNNQIIAMIVLSNVAAALAILIVLFVRRVIFLIKNWMEKEDALQYALKVSF